jgi:hypothetical protein
MAVYDDAQRGEELMQDSSNNLFFEAPPGTGAGLPLFLDRAEEPCPNLQLSYCPKHAAPL